LSRDDKKNYGLDDDPGVIFTVKHGLEGLNPDYQIITVTSGFQCLEKL